MIPLPTPIFHITPIDNLCGILAAGGLCCNSALRRDGIAYTNIAHANIQDRRSRTPVTCGPGGTLHDYVPFYFAPRSPMLYAIAGGRVQGFDGGQTPILHLVSSAQLVQDAGLSFVFTDGHATMELSTFYATLDRLDQVDWSVMPLRIWRDTNADPDRKRRRNAEFLVHKFFPWELITEIGVINATIQQQVERLLYSAKHKPMVTVRPNWYY